MANQHNGAASGLCHAQDSRIGKLAIKCTFSSFCPRCTVIMGRYLRSSDANMALFIVGEIVWSNA